MLADSSKISIRQTVFLFLTIIFTPAIRIIPIYTAKQAKQAAWLAPIAAVILLVLLAFIWQEFYKKYKDYSLIDIYSDIIGSVAGKILAFVQFIWMVLLTALYIRYFSSRLVGSIYPNINVNIFAITMLVFIAYSLRFGLKTLARFNEIVLPFLMVVLYVLFALMISNIKLSFLVPISHRDILPVLSASVGITGVFSYFTFIFIIGDRINNKENIKKTGIQAALTLFITLTAVIVTTIGSFSYAIAQRTQLPFLIAVKQISLFNTLEKIESIVVAIWIISDFVLISFFVICAMNIIKSLFNLSDTGPLINIYLIFIFLFSLLLAKNVFELQKFSDSFIIPGNIALGFIVPAVMLAIGKMRKKV